MHTTESNKDRLEREKVEYTLEIESKIFEPWKLGLDDVGENNYLGIVTWKKNGKISNVVYVHVNIYGEVLWRGMRNYFSVSERKEITENAEALITLASQNDWWLQFLSYDRV